MNNNGAKRASNRYGNNRSSKCRGRPTEHIKYAWARDFNEITLLQHLSDHRKSFGSTTKKNTVSMLLSLQI